MTIHYSEESLCELLNSDKFQSEFNNYKQIQQERLKLFTIFLNKIEINKNYYKTGIVVKKKYKNSTLDETTILKEIKNNLNKITTHNNQTIIQSIISGLKKYPHIYERILDFIFIQSISQPLYSKYYSEIILELHKVFKNTELLVKIIQSTKQTIDEIETDNSSAYLELCSNNQKTDKLVGYSGLITELENNHTISGYIHPLLCSLFDEIEKQINDDDIYRYLCCIENIFKTLDSIDESYYTRLDIQKQSVKSMKNKFKIMDILESK